MATSIRERGAPDGIDRLARALGWLSLALGMMKFIETRRNPQPAGLDDQRDMIRIYGPRELATSIQDLPGAGPAGPKARIVGDLMEIATLLPALRAHNPQRGKAALALAAVAGVTLFDILAWRAATRQRRSR